MKDAAARCLAYVAHPRAAAARAARAAVGGGGADGRESDTDAELDDDDDEVPADSAAVECVSAECAARVVFPRARPVNEAARHVHMCPPRE